MTDLSKEAWYHGRVSRVDAEKILDTTASGEGTFLVRDSLTTTGEYVLSLCHQSKKFHYMISRQQDGSVAIQDGAKFPGPIELVQYHTRKVDGLLTTLQVPCARRAGQPPQGYRFISHEDMQAAMREAALLLGYQEHQVNDALLKRRSAFEQLVGGILHRKQLWFHGPITRDESEYRIRNYGVRDGLFLVRERTQVNSFALCVVFRSEVYHYLLDMNNLGQLSIENGRKFENLLQVVDHYSRTPDGLLCALNDVCPVTVFEEGGHLREQARVKHGPRRIESSEIEVFDSLGAGTFGAVRAAVYKPKNGEPQVECAVKCLKTDNQGTNERSEILREADAMAMLDHPYIVRLYGIVVTTPIMLVMEIASLGPLNKFLRKHPNFPHVKIIDMVLQIAQGMEYLEKVRFVHRDLAARNVLVVDEDNVKISDFGMSRAIAGNSEYYRVSFHPYTVCIGVDGVFVCRRSLLAGGLSSGMLLSASTTPSLIASQTCGVLESQPGRPSLTVPSLTRV
ncbi:Tyrosine-protein kinase ZAP-70 [Geodia barretti]|uniref:Tyrosine-protein kinase n=1 Tax=Geodia barretti TaxID=519541 RepID=A0AA35TDE1_GEOBA|nr:Tyrosine-protein kinase ZAP-70 [Geodia barretti]